MRREVPGCFDQQARERVVDFRSFDTGEAEAHGGNGFDEGLEESAQRPLLPIGPDVYAGHHDLRVVLRQSARFVDELTYGARAIVAACQRGRAEGAVLVAAVLDFQEAPALAHCSPSA